jgi:hypothetical protein
MKVDRTKLSSKAEYAEIEDSLTSFGGSNRRTDSSDCDPQNGRYYVATAHYDPDLTDDDEDNTQEELSNNVEVSVLFAVDWERMKLLLADAEFELEPAEPLWLNVETWRITGDGFDSLSLCRHIKESHHYPFVTKAGACFLTEAS